MRPMDNEAELLDLSQFVSQPSIGAPIKNRVRPKTEPMHYVKYVYPVIKTTGLHDSVGTELTTGSGQSEGGESSKYNKKGKGKKSKVDLNAIKRLLNIQSEFPVEFVRSEPDDEVDYEVDDDIATRSIDGLDEKLFEEEVTLNNDLRNNRYPELPKRKPKKSEHVDPSNSRFFKGTALTNMGSEDSPQHEVVQITNELATVPSGNELKKAKTQVAKMEESANPSMEKEAPMRKSKTKISEAKSVEHDPPMKMSSPTPSKEQSALVVENVFLNEVDPTGDVVIDIAPPATSPKPPQKKDKVVKAEKPNEIVDQHEVFYQQGLTERQAALHALSDAFDEYEEEAERYRNRSKKLCCSLSILVLVLVAFVAAASYAFLTRKIVYIDDDGAQHSVAEFFEATALNNNNF